jgi:hypothetical protein
MCQLYQAKQNDGSKRRAMSDITDQSHEERLPLSRREPVPFVVGN